MHQKKRVVRIDVTKKLNLGKAEVNGLGLLGLRYAWRVCPGETAILTPSYHGVTVDVYRDFQRIYQFHEARSDSLQQHVTLNSLWSVWDAQRERERAEAERKQRDARQKALALEQARRAKESAAFWRMFWLVALLCVSAFVWFRYRAPIMAFYYHNFTKHPAEGLVNESVLQHLDLDGKGLAEELDKVVKARNPIEAKVRAAQAEKLAQRAREMSEVYRAQEHLADAMIDVERARRAEKHARDVLKRLKEKED